VHADVLNVTFSLALLAAVAWLPGLGVCRALRPGMSRLTALAAAPAVSAGLLYTSGGVLTALKLPVDWRLAGSVVAAGLVLLVRAERRNWSAWDPRLLPHSVLGAWVVGAAVWALGIRHLLAVPPHNDGYNHGFFVARIARLATLDPSVVIPHDVLSGGTGAAYYPLALHQQAALLVRAADLDVAVAWTLTSLSLVVLALPLGMYALGRYLFPDNPRAVAGCAWVAALTPGATYATTWWGGYALAAGLALSPGVLLCLLATTARLSASASLLAGIALAGVAGVHTSELTFVGVVAATLVIAGAAGRKDVRMLLRGTLRLSAACGTAVLLLLPALALLHRGLQERTFAPEAVGLPFVHTVLEVVVQFSFVPPATPPALVVALWLGVVLALLQREALSWLAAWLFFAVVYVWLAAFPGQVITSLTASWYSDRFRLGMLLSFLAIPLIALAVAGPHRDAKAPRAGVWRAGSLALAAVLGITTVLDSVSAIRENYGHYSLIGADERAAFGFLAAHNRPGDHVLNQHQDDSAWMYSLYGVTPVFAVKTNNFESTDWRDALYLSRHIAEAGHDARTDELLVRFDVRFVYVGDQVFPTEKADMRSTSLEASKSFAEVFHRGRAHVFEWTP